MLTILPGIARHILVKSLLYLSNFKSKQYVLKKCTITYISIYLWIDIIYKGHRKLPSGMFAYSYERNYICQNVNEEDERGGCCHIGPDRPGVSPGSRLPPVYLSNRQRNEYLRGSRQPE